MKRHTRHKKELVRKNEQVRKRGLPPLIVLCFLCLFVAKSVWASEDTYTNPIIPLDYSDPDVIRVGDDFYLTASSFNCVPGLRILHSRDLVNWVRISLG